jgi:hypothetical protein
VHIRSLMRMLSLRLLEFVAQKYPFHGISALSAED